MEKVLDFTARTGLVRRITPLADAQEHDGIKVEELIDSRPYADEQRRRAELWARELGYRRPLILAERRELDAKSRLQAQEAQRELNRAERELFQKLESVGILLPFTEQSVGRYKKRVTRRTERFYYSSKVLLCLLTPLFCTWRHLGEGPKEKFANMTDRLITMALVSSLTGATYGTVSALLLWATIGSGIAGDSVLLLFAACMIVSALSRFIPELIPPLRVLRDKAWIYMRRRKLVAWRREKLEEFDSHIPERVLDNACAIKSVIPDAEFLVEVLIERPSELRQTINRLLDPFLILVTETAGLKSWYYVDVWDEPDFQKSL